MRWASLGLLLAFAPLAACGPIPGGSLEGHFAEIPSDWTSAVKDGHTLCEIESRPEDPHSIQLDCFLYDGALFVQSHRWAQADWWPVQSWASIWLEHPEVQVRIGDALYPLLAVPVTESPMRENMLAFRGYDPVPDGIVLFRFDRRP
jgi:hypothetical protein